MIILALSFVVIIVLLSFTLSREQEFSVDLSDATAKIPLDCEIAPRQSEMRFVQQFRFKPRSLELFQFRHQKETQGTIDGWTYMIRLEDVAALYEENVHPVPDQLVDFFLKYPGEYPKAWRTKNVWLWGRIYRHPRQGLFVRGLGWDSVLGKCEERNFSLSDNMGPNDYMVITRTEKPVIAVATKIV